METALSGSLAVAAQQLKELTLLYRFSNTMLSTIRLNKLTHLILTAITTGTPPIFERAMLFLLNEKAGVLQGMLGVTAGVADGLVLVGGEENSLSSRWDIGDEVIACQRSTDFCAKVQTVRIENDDGCRILNQVILENRQMYITNAECMECNDCGFLKLFGIRSFAAAPLAARGKILGVIVVDNPLSDGAIKHETLHLLQLLANQAGMAIENSMLFNRLEEAHSSLRDARERIIHGERLAAIGEMAANLAHELKNPLITIGGFAGRLHKSLPCESGEYHYADTIVREVNRLEKMLADILAFSGKPSICYSNCHLEHILEECFENCKPTLEDRGVRLFSDMGACSWPILGDSHQLKQVFLNLLLNACDAMPAGGEIDVSVCRDDSSINRAIVNIKDTGGGIPAEMLPKIFNPFFTTKSHGTGLGLSIVNRILANHSGRIEVANNDKGAVFTVFLPLAETEV
jgi:two-component system sensor histidine kinase HydH